MPEIVLSDFFYGDKSEEFMHSSPMLNSNRPHLRLARLRGDFFSNYQEGDFLPRKSKIPANFISWI